MKYFSTFSGIGGFEVGINNAYSSKSLSAIEQNREGRNGNIDETRDDVLFGHQPPLCVGYSEIDKYAISVYERQFNGHKNYGDITKINADELPDFDCLVGGFPCQAFSIAGKRRGFEDTRGTLFFDLARILKAKTPRLFVFENVKGLLSHDNGNTFKTIIATIDELGYDCQWQVLNSKNHGVPQNRERIIIVGHLRGTRRPEVFPIGSHDNQATELPGQYTNTLTARYYGGQANGSYVAESELNAQDNTSIRQDSRQKQAEPDTDEFSRGEEAAPHIRRLTPVECERLQGFPDNWTKFGIGEVPISDTQRYKMCGNAVTVNVIRDVFERILS